MLTRAKKKSGTQYLFKVILKRRRSVSRTVALRGDQTLDDLHEAIFRAFDRFDPHLYSFYFPKAPSRGTRPRRGEREYTAPQGFVDGADLVGEQSRFDAAQAKIDDLRLKVSQSFEYLFDFGDNWWHEVTVDAMGAIDGRARYPQLVEKRGASPPQYEAEDDGSDDGG